MGELQAELQRLSGTTLDAQGAANVWAGLARANWLDLVGALNTRAGLARADWKDLQGILNHLAGTSGLEAGAAAASIVGYGLKLPGTAGNYVSSPDSVLNSVTGDIDIRVCAKKDSWTAGTYGTAIGKFGVGVWSPSYLLQVSTTGILRYVTTIDGGANIYHDSTVAVPFADAVVGWIRVTHDVDNGAGGNDAKFYTSTDGVTWTQLGATVTIAGVTHIFNGTASVSIGSYDASGDPWAGTIYYAEVRNGIDGPIVAKFDASAVQSSGAQTPATVATTFRNNGDQTDTTTSWTVNGTGWSWEGASFAGKPVTALSLPGTSGNYVSTPDSAGNSVVGDIDIRVKAALTDWTPSPNQVLVAKDTTSGNQRSYCLQVIAGGILRFQWSTDGTTTLLVVADSTVAPTVADGATLWVRATLAVATGQALFYTSTDGIAWTPLGSAPAAAGATSIFNSTAVVEVGSNFVGTNNLLNGTVYYAEVRNGIDGPIVARFDPTAIARTGTRTPTTTVQPGGTPNLLTPNQASIETDATGWAANENAPVIARSTAQFLDGAASLSITSVAVGPATSSAVTTPSTVSPVVPGKLYTARISYRAAATGRSCLTGIQWRTAADAAISETTGGSVTDTTTGWTEATVTGVAPATAAYGRVRAIIQSTLATEVHYVDRISLVESAATWTMSGAVWDLVEV